MSCTESLGDGMRATCGRGCPGRLLIEAGSVILRAPTEKMLFERVCRLLIDIGGFRLAWAALMEPAGDRLVEVALAGRDAETTAALREHARSEQGRRVLTRRLKDREPWVVNVRAEREDADPDSPWASLASRPKVDSIAYLPIAADHVVHGVLVLASDGGDCFNADRLRGLARLPSDLAVKLDWLGRRAGSPSRDEAFHRAAARLQAFFDAAPQAILLVSPGTIETNSTFAKMFGIARTSTALSTDMSRFFAPGIWGDMVALQRRRLAGMAAPDRYQTVGVRSNGKRFSILVQATTVDLEAGQVHAIFITDLSPELA